MIRRKYTLAGTLTLSVLALLSTVPASAQDAFEPRFRVVAEQGDELPDRSDAELFIVADPTFLAIDRSGRVFFDGTAASEVPGASTFRGFFVADGESARTVFAVGDAAPTGGIATGADIEGIVEAFYGADGQALIAAELDGGSLPGEALLTDVDESKRVAAVVGTAFGGACGHTDFGNGFASSQFALNEGVLVVHGIRDRTLCGNSFRELLRTTDLSTFTTLTLENAPVPGVSNAEFEHIFSGASLATDGSYAFTGNYVQEEGPGEQVGLFVAAPDGGIRQVIATRTPAPGTSDEVAALRIWQVRAAEEPEGAARTAYVATFFDGVTTEPMHVFDSAAGTAPVVSTGSVLGDFTFAASRTDVRIQMAEDDTLVVVGDTTGGGVSAGGEAVWRHRAGEQDPLEVVLFEGGPVPGDHSGNDGQTISRLISVHVNSDGRIAAEVDLLPAGEGILIEEPFEENRGKFVIAAVRRDVLPTRSGLGVATTLSGRRPNFPVVTGAGEDGRSGRFSANGEFVFRAIIDPDEGGPNRTVLLTASVDPERELCRVQARLRRGSLNVKSDNRDCDLTVRSLGDGEFELVPGRDTEVNGMSGTVRFDGVTRSVTVRTGAGNDAIRIESTDPALDESSVTDVFGALRVSTGDGLDTLRLSELEVGGTLAVDVGRSGAETLTLSSCGARALSLKGKVVSLGGTLDLLQLTGPASLALPSSGPAAGPPESLRFTNCLLGGLKVKGSRFSDLLRFEDSRIEGAVTIDTKGGIQDDVRFMRCELTASAKLKAKRTDTLIARFEDVVMDDGGLRIDTGRQGCEVAITNCSIAFDVRLKLGGALPTGAPSDIDVENSVCDGALIVKGKGKLELSLSQGSEVAGLSVNTKRSGLDQFSFVGCDISSGHAVVTSRAEVVVANIQECTVIEGDLRLRTGNGDDRVVVRQCDVAGTLQAVLGRGDDQMTVDRTTVVRNLRLFGSTGDDTLTLLDSGVTGETVIDSFETR